MSTSTTTPTISISGKAFVSGENSTRFMVRGIALATDPTLNFNLNISDILSNEHSAYFATNILPNLISMNVNCIRVYQVNPDNKHNETMNALEAAGIYVMVGLVTSNHSINQYTAEYSQATFAHGARIVDEFQSYDNTFCFSVGNEVEFPGQQATYVSTNNPSYTPAQVVAATIQLEYNVAQAMKSFARDIKAHISTNQYRTIPVGCAMQDGPQSSWGMNNVVAYEQGLIGTNIIAQYYVSGAEAERMDYIGINSYGYVAGHTPADTAYDALENEVSLLPVPVFLSESGAITGSDRDWADVAVNYNSKYTIGSQISGQIAFQMFEQGHGYGMNNVTSDTVYAPVAMGGIPDLTAQFLAAKSATVPSIAATPTTINAPTSATSPGSPPNTTPVYAPLTVQLSWPSSLLSLKTYVQPNGTATFSNYATETVQVVQQGVVLATIGARIDANTPKTVTVPITTGQAIQMQGNVVVNGVTEMGAICQVAGSAVIDGCNIANNVSWGEGVACNFLIAVPVANHQTTIVDVVQNGHVMGSVPAAAADSNSPQTATIALIAGVEVYIQTAGTFNTICQVPAGKVEAGLTINNDVTWGAACIIG